MATDDHDMHRLYVIMITHPFQIPTAAVAGDTDMVTKISAAESFLYQPLKNFHISICSNPHQAVARHNQKRTVATDLHDAAPWCYLDMVVGPFFTTELAQVFSHILLHGTRGRDSIVKAARFLLFEKGWAAEHSLQLHDSEEPLPEGLSLAEYLDAYDAPPDYMEVVHVLDNAVEEILMASC